MKLQLFFFIYFFTFKFSFAQAEIADSINISEEKMSDSFFQSEIKFISYLLDNYEFCDAIFVLNQLKNNSDIVFDQQKSDVFNYFLGWSHYNIQSVDTAAFYLSQVSKNSSFYLKSFYYSSLNKISSVRYNEAENILKKNVSDEDVFSELSNFQKAGIALLKSEYKTFDTLSKKFTYDFYVIAEEEQNFINYKTRMLAIKDKSPFIAGLMSAIIPGSGKFYAGNKGQALGAFFPCLLLGVLTTENYVKNGSENIGFILSASLFSIFYIGNIWGSSLSVKISRDEHFKEIHDNILLDLVIPLRRIFD